MKYIWPKRMNECIDMVKLYLKQTLI